MNNKKWWQRGYKANIGDSMLIAVFFTLAVIIMIILALVWVQFRPQLDTLAINQTVANQLNNIGNSYLIQGSQGTLLFFFFVMVIAMFISAYYESSSFLALPISIFFLIMAIFTSMVLSDTAHAILTAPALQSLVVQHFSSILYLEDNLPLVIAALTIGYIGFVIMRRGQNTGGAGASGAYAGRLMTG